MLFWSVTNVMKFDVVARAVYFPPEAISSLNGRLLRRRGAAPRNDIISCWFRYVALGFDTDFVLLNQRVSQSPPAFPALTANLDDAGA
jgi:hypothetical protein